MLYHKLYLFLLFYLFATFSLTAQEKKVETTSITIGDTVNTIRAKVSMFLPSRNKKVYKSGRKWFFQLHSETREKTVKQSANFRLSMNKKGAQFKGMGQLKKVIILDNTSSFSFQLPDLGQPSFIQLISFSWDLFNLILTNREANGNALRISLPEYMERKIYWNKKYNGQLIDTVYRKDHFPFERQECQLIKMEKQGMPKIACFKNFDTYQTAAGEFTVNYWFDPIKYGILKVEIIHPDDKKFTLNLTKTNY